MLDTNIQRGSRQPVSGPRSDTALQRTAATASTASTTEINFEEKSFKVMSFLCDNKICSRLGAKIRVKLDWMRFFSQRDQTISLPKCTF